MVFVCNREEKFDEAGQQFGVRLFQHQLQESHTELPLARAQVILLCV
jgi:hypothetical protein